MIIIAWLFPGIGNDSSLVPLSTINKHAITLLFFFYGLRLSPRRLLDDLKNWRLHITVQGITFILFPLIVLIFFPLFKGTEYLKFWLAMFFLATLPSTVSSSVVMVSIAKGNIPAAIFNASISGLLGIVFTPLWMGFFLDSSMAGFDFTDTLVDLILQILLPVILGLVLNRFWGKWAASNKRYLSLFDKGVVLSIVYESFSNSFTNGVFKAVPMWTLLIMSGSVIALFFIVFYFSNWISRKLGFSRQEQITVTYCASKKSLIHGSVMAGVMFSGNAIGSLFLVPIMIYHAFQLFYIGILATKEANRA